MPTFIYRTKDGTRVPSVTTINKIGQDSGGLIHWAWQLGIDGKDYRQVRDEAAEGGTVGHALVEAAIHGRDPDLAGFGDEARDMGQRAFAAYREWREHTRLEIVASEVPLVSERYRFGGCMDAVARRSDGRLCICDWKSGGLYPDHLCQLAAYGALWNENNPQPITGGYHLVRFNKDTGDFTHAYFADLSEAWTAFQLKRELYDAIARIKKRI